MEPTLGLAFLAGLLSFVSPCVLPLVPAYVGYMGGRVTSTVAARTAIGPQASALVDTSIKHRFVTFLHGVAFVAGFTFIFVVLGLLATAFVMQIGRQNLSLVETLIARVGGLLVIFFGLHFMGILPSIFRYLLANKPLISSPLPGVVLAAGGGLLITWAFVDWLLIMPVLAAFILWLLLGGALTHPERFWTTTLTAIQRALYSEVRLQMTARGQQSFASSALMGVVFAAGWTPCIGPVYGAVLTMAANGGDVGRAGSLLAAYSIGLGIPFLLTALLLDSAKTALKRLQRQMHKIELATGAFLVVIGTMVATGTLQALSSSFAVQFTDVSIRLEECVLGLANGEKTLGEVGPCLAGEAAPALVGEADSSISPTIPDAALPPSPETLARPVLPRSITDLASSAERIDAVYGVEPGNLASNFQIITDDGREMLLSDLRGKTVVLNFWATWCGPCRVEMPEFERAYDRHRNDGLEIVAVNNRESLSDITQFREDIGVTFPFALDEDGEIQDLYGVRQYPTTLVINPAGLIVERHLGPMTAEQIAQLVEKGLG